MSKKIYYKLILLCCSVFLIFTMGTANALSIVKPKTSNPSCEVMKASGKYNCQVTPGHKCCGGVGEPKPVKDVFDRCTIENYNCQATPGHKCCGGVGEPKPVKDVFDRCTIENYNCKASPDHKCCSSSPKPKARNHSDKTGVKGDTSDSGKSDSSTLHGYVQSDNGVVTHVAPEIPSATGANPSYEERVKAAKKKRAQIAKEREAFMKARDEKRQEAGTHSMDNLIGNRGFR